MNSRAVPSQPETAARTRSRTERLDVGSATSVAWVCDMWYSFGPGWGRAERDERGSARRLPHDSGGRVRDPSECQEHLRGAGGVAGDGERLDGVARGDDVRHDAVQ